jgi:putative DNA primase/helicase
MSSGDTISIAGWRGAYGEPRRSKPKSDAERAADFKRALDIRRHARPLKGTAGETYLRSRGLRPDIVLYGPSGWPASVRWTDDAMRKPEPPVKPGIVIDVVDAAGNVTGIHRILFRRDGTVERDAEGKRVKRGLGVIWGNAATLDCEPDPDGHWGIAEGVETAMACRQLYRIPTWAAVFGGNMVAITPPPWARQITIFADRDPVSPRLGYAPGFKFAERALLRWRQRPGIESVRVLAPRPPPMPGKRDFADILGETPYAS